MLLSILVHLALFFVKEKKGVRASGKQNGEKEGRKK